MGGDEENEGHANDNDEGDEKSRDIRRDEGNKKRKLREKGNEEVGYVNYFDELRE